MAADERPPPPTMEGNEPETIAEFQDALAKLELKVSAAEKRQRELKTTYVEAKKHIKHLQRERRQLLDLMILKTKKFEDLMISSDEEDTPETFITADTAAPRLGGVSKVPGTSIPKSAPAARKVSASGGAAPVRKKATAKRPDSALSESVMNDAQAAMFGGNPNFMEGEDELTTTRPF